MGRCPTRSLLGASLQSPYVTGRHLKRPQVQGAPHWLGLNYPLRSLLSATTISRGPSTEYITERCKISLKTICLIISVDALIVMQKLLWSFATLILQIGTRLKAVQVVQTRVNDRSQLADFNQHVSSLCFQ